MNFRSLLRRLALFSVALAAPAHAARLKLLIVFQDQTIPKTVEASHVLHGTPYDVQSVRLAGPAAQLSALYSKAIDIGHMGDTSLIIEQGRHQTPWTASTAPLRIIAGWRSNDTEYPPIVTVARTEAHITTPADAKGHRWAYNFGGFNYLQFVLSVLKGGLKEEDIDTVRLGDQNATAAAFLSGRVDLYSGASAAVADALAKGTAKLVLTSDQLDIPALGVWTARGDVLRDPAKHEAIADFLGRVQKYWSWYAQHPDEVQKIYTEQLKMSPTLARYNVSYLKATFQPLDDGLVKREQHIADVLQQAGAIPKTIDVNVEFARDFNVNTVPQTK